MVPVSRHIGHVTNILGMIEAYVSTCILLVVSLLGLLRLSVIPVRF